MPAVTDPLYDRHPQVKVTVWSTSSIEIQKGLDQFELDAGITYLESEPLHGVLHRELYVERYVLLTPEHGPLGGRNSATWREAADLPLCLLTPNMQNRRILDGVFKSLDCSPRPQLETNSVVNLCAHVRSGRLSSIVPKTLIQVLGMPSGAIALDLVSPEVERKVGLIVPNREPCPRSAWRCSHCVPRASAARMWAERQGHPIAFVISSLGADTISCGVSRRRRQPRFS